MPKLGDLTEVLPVIANFNNPKLAISLLPGMIAVSNAPPFV